MLQQTKIEALYSEIKQLIASTNKDNITFILGDLNAKIGRGRGEDTVGEDGLGIRNDRDDVLIQFCQEDSRDGNPHRTPRTIQSGIKLTIY